jgi:hypothetical protein
MNNMAKSHALSLEQKQRMLDSIGAFRTWLLKTLPRSEVAEYDDFKFPRPTRDDWVMWVDAKDSAVHFNSFILCKCSFEYFEMVVIHECFHLFVQDLPNKADARMVKHGFGETIMKMLDIEADYFTAQFYKETKNASLVDIFSLYEEGSRVFGDPRVLTPKLERFIGSILSIANMYFNHPTKTKVIETDLYLPTIDGIHTEETLYVVISRNAHYMLDQIRANAHDFAEIKKAYANIGGLTRRGYVELLMKFSSRALKRDLPARIERQVKALR